MNTRNRQLTPEQFDQINQLYWEEGYDQADIADMFGCTQTHISRIVRGIACSYHCSFIRKIKRLNNNIIPNKNEKPQARTLRARRQNLHSTKLNWDKVSQIRELYFHNRKTQQELASMFGVNQSTISKLIQGRTWKTNA